MGKDKGLTRTLYTGYNLDMIHKCLMDGCLLKYHAKGFCKNHYRKVFGLNKKRYLKVKNDPLLTKKTKQAVKEYKTSDRYKEMRKAHDKKYYLENREALLAYRKHRLELKRFDTRRDNVLFRDGNKCPLPGDHSKTLVVHHKDGQGRCTDNPNNDPANLITLCKSHHMKIHSPKKLIKL